MASCLNEKPKQALQLFGGDNDWSSDAWTASDDRVRGGKSQSYLDCSNKKIGRFYGNLDIKTLGGAGFASQRTTVEDSSWDLSGYAGIKLSIEKADAKRYTLILKDELLPANPDNGREQASISYEADFDLSASKEHDRFVFIPWASLNPTYRGKLKKDAKPLDTRNVKRISIMMRSFFGTQEGDFSLSIRSITAEVKTPEPETTSSPVDADDRKLEDGAAVQPLADDGAMNHIDYYYFKGIRVPKTFVYVLTVMACIGGFINAMR